ncbi:hypothetical protein GF412_01120 [Candidatus Micrarchaeota archaeon]|nr:hypothetical protein [Candidatus Micrarchaeota archaeon]MBD3417573.1 hypothetical protein [Candidatus Micrarchaeota archaeon]
MEKPKVERKISLNLYLIALVLTVLVFSLGVYVGMVIDESAKDKVEGELLALEQDLYLSRVLFLVEDEIGEFCPIYSEKLEAVDAERELIGDRLEYLESVRGLYDEELKERYYYLEFENYLLMKKMQNECGADYVLVIFFYDGEDESRTQGEELDALRDSDSKVKVFSFNGESDSAVVEVLKEQYSVASYPAVVIDGELVSGLHSSEELASG